MNKINPEVKAKWVAALRSGNYPQTKGRLRDANGFCCFGVLCDLKDHTAWSASGNYEYQSALPPVSVRQFSGIDALDDIEVEIYGTYKPLARHNDDGRTFAEIADAIEAQL